MSVVNLVYLLAATVVLYLGITDHGIGKGFFNQITYTVLIIILVIVGINEQKKAQKYWYLYGFSSLLLYLVAVNIYNVNLLLSIYIICFISSLYCLFGFYKHRNNFEQEKKE